MVLGVMGKAWGGKKQSWRNPENRNRNIGTETRAGQKLGGDKDREPTSHSHVFCKLSADPTREGRERCPPTSLLGIINAEGPC